MNIDADRVEDAITEKTKAIMPVHLFGRPCDMDRIMSLAGKYNLKVIEDCAQSFGAKALGKYTGTIGNVGAYSFFPTKNLGCYGDGGLIATDDDGVAEHCRMLRSHGSIKKYHNEILGYNSRLDSVQAAILRLKLPLVEEYNANRRRVAQAYFDAFSSLEGVIPPAVVEGHVFHQYTVRVLHGRRDEVQRKLKEMGIATMVYYPVPQDRLPIYAGKYPTFPQNEVLVAEVLSLPIWPQMDEVTQAQIIECVRNIII
jgi:dTDP-4-amino-4,6-dideoxygalactose transaminase